MTPSQKKLMLLALYFGAFIAAFTENIINVALVDITAEFSVTSVTAQWLVTGYMIVSSIMMAAMAFLLQRFTLRQVFFGASGIFIVSTVAAFFAPNYTLLLIARLAEALGTGMFITIMMINVLILAPKESTGFYLAIGGCCITLGPAFGPVISGLMVTFFGWRFVFIPPLIFMIITAVLAIPLLRNYQETHPASFDVVSLLLAALGLTIVVYALSQVTTATMVSLVELVIGCAVLALFGRRQLKSEHPFLNVQPLFNARYTVAFLLNAICMMTTFSLSVLLPLYFQNSLGQSALMAGVFILIPVMFNAVAALFGGRILDHRGPWPLIPLGFICIFAGQCAIWAFSSSLNAALIIAGASLAYLGVGLILSPCQTTGLKQLPGNEYGDGVSIINIGNMIAASLGPSLFVGIMSGSIAAASSDLAPALIQAAGFADAMLVATGIGLVGLLVSIIFTRKVK